MLPAVAHPRDRLITLFGRKPVLEALEDRTTPVRRVFLAQGARGEIVDRIRALAKERGVELRLESAERVSRISKRPKQDQGVAADVDAPSHLSLEEWVASAPISAKLIAIDGVTTPANVGMIVRSAAVLGLQGVLLPRRGSPEISPSVIKASAGVALRAPVLRCGTLAEGLEPLRAAGFRAYGLDDARGEPLDAIAPPPRAVFVLGNESEGIAPAHLPLIDAWARIPMARAGDSLNVACAASIVAYELARRAARG